MHGTSAKLVYCAMLLMLAVFVAMPVRPAQVETAEIVAMPLSTESRLARAIHERISVEAAGRLSAVRQRQLAAEEDGLRQLAFADDVRGSRVELIDSLADELSAAMLQRSEIATRPDSGKAERGRIDAVVRALTAAINAEVRGVSA